jgi:tRNA (guanosine-2'-O-)-methyltransferase
MAGSAASGGRDVSAQTLDAQTAERIVSVLSPMVLDARRERLEQALARRTRDVTVVIENIANEHNAAAVLRSAEAFGCFEVHIVESESSFQVSRNVASGAHKWLHLSRHASTAGTYEELRSRGYEIWASVVRGDSVPIYEVPADRKVALVFGNEHRGLSEEAIESADGRFMVPMTGMVESLNISVAAATSCWDVMSRRRTEGAPMGLDPEDRRCVLAAWLARSARGARALLAREGLPFPVLLDRPLQMIDDEKQPAGAFE